MVNLAFSTRKHDPASVITIVHPSVVVPVDAIVYFDVTARADDNYSLQR